MTNKRFNPNQAEKLLSEGRKSTLQLDKMLDYLDVRKDDIVADLGAGPGLFTIPIAKLTTKDVYAIDIEPKMLQMLKEKAENESITNISYVLSELEEIQLDNESVTRALNTFVIHEVSSINKSIGEMKRILKPGGKLLLMDWEAVETKSGPPLEIRIPSSEMIKKLEENGFQAEQIPVHSDYYAIKAVKGE